MRFPSLSSLAALSALASSCLGLVIRETIPPNSGVVTFDKHSLFVRGERVILYAGEYHPFRQAVPDLWLDIFQKMRAMSYTTASFYVDWFLLEGEQGVFRADGVFDIANFIDMAKQLESISLLWRPGPYINGETAGGGMPGWIRRVPGAPRTMQPDNKGFQNASLNYWTNICKILADGKIDNGGPVIMVQIENEYVFTNGYTYQPEYLQKYEDVCRLAGVVVPFSYNDITRPAAAGQFAYGKGVGSVEVYGQDSYPLGFGCGDPSYWPPPGYGLGFPENYATLHAYQGGAIDGWGGYGYDQCAIVVDGSAERLLYLTAVEFVTTVQSIYMTYGGTNWGNLGQPYGYTSYDYGAAIAENRTITREKYGAAADYTSYNQVSYNLTVPTSLGNITFPQTILQLVLNGRDAKLHHVDYSIGNNVSIWYSSPDIFAYSADQSGKSVLVVYGGYAANSEPQELAFINTNLAKPTVVEANNVTFSKVKDHPVMSWTDSPTRRVVNYAKALVYILDRDSAVNYWRIQLSNSTARPYTNPNAPSIIITGGQLIRTAKLSGRSVSIMGDVKPIAFEIIAGMPKNLMAFAKTSTGTITFNVTYTAPTVSLPNLNTLDWKYIDDFPELQLSYDDSKWPKANIIHSPNDEFDQGTPTSLSASDYGLNTDSLIYRGHFNATGNETFFAIDTAGGLAFPTQCFFNGHYIGGNTSYWAGNAYDINRSDNYSIVTPLKPGPAVITMLIDHMGMDEQPHVGNVQFKLIRGISHYQLDGHNQSDITWVLTGNLGGEKYYDKSRGPLNEGGVYAERHGYHLPKAPTSSWASGKPTDGLTQVGNRFYYATFDLDLPEGYDIPLSVVFSNGDNANSYYRVRMFINGWNFGKYVPNVGPQTNFPVPEGILNYRGTNYIALGLWAMNPDGDALGSIDLVAGQPIQWGYKTPALVNGTDYEPRAGVY
ncbi:glycoside hydrolase superfamily [Neohortaea acidophila]|uniref:Beta-galactosidase n=1 Tax=Neohortaea acidophila TaxID=245834 RepID=A0A6A6PVU5_9PEZI|nr:glycoside hydrolase superfamily [Neohortaea acidophila]KAF2483799.1 glycoside hydrolase superfamily [Neohortaea acidophila]